MSREDIRIAYFIDRLIQGGTELQLAEQINRLHLEGIYQELFCLYKSKDHEKIPVSCRVNILDIRKLMSLRCLRQIYFLVKDLRKRRFNIAQTYFFDSTLLGVTAARIAGHINIFSCRRDLGFWYTPTILTCLKIANRITDSILVNSTAVKQSVTRREKAPFSKVHVIPNGIDLSKFNYSPEVRQTNRSRFSIQPMEICVGIIANMDRRVKRLDLFIKAADHILRARKDVRFIVLGDGHLRAELIAMARGLGIAPNIAFLGSDVSKHDILSAMDIGALTSDSEGFSNAIMEYMAAGIPVVATNVGGNTDLVRHNETGFLIRPGDFRELAERTLDLANDRRKCLEFGLNAKIAVAGHNWDSIIQTTLTFYEERLSQ